MHFAYVPLFGLKMYSADTDRFVRPSMTGALIYAFRVRQPTVDAVYVQLPVRKFSANKTAKAVLHSRRQAYCV